MNLDKLVHEARRQGANEFFRDALLICAVITMGVALYTHVFPYSAFVDLAWAGGLHFLSIAPRKARIALIRGALSKQPGTE